jgi:lipoprotein-anchoring transpeptidase ErfK/SrfK
MNFNGMVEMTRNGLTGLLLAWMAIIALSAATCAADDKPAGDFAFPPEIAAQEEAAAAGQTEVPADAPPAKPATAKPAKPAAAKPGRTAPAPTPAAAPVDALPAASKRPLPLVDYSLAPEALNRGDRSRTPVQLMLAQTAEDGKTSVGDMVKMISSDGGGQLDHIIINLATQRIYECNANNEVLHEDKVSSGRSGLETPAGDYTVQNKAPKAYSQKYTAWMLQWMGLTADGSYGMHGLEGSSYERHLGHQASHGCVRLSRKYAKDLYPRVKVGMPVKIINDKDLKLAAFQPLNPEAATSQVLDMLSPVDPDAVFY